MKSIAQLGNSFAVISTATLLFTSVALAQEPFQLRAQKRAFSEEPGNAPPTSLRINRDQLNLNAGVPMMAPTAPLRAGAAVRPLSGAVTSVRDLSNYDLELIVDESMSMRQRDCPGGLSRWAWCGSQLTNLSRQLAPYAPRGFNITTFAGDFQTYEGATAQQLVELFQFPEFSRGTRLSAPLQSRISNYLAHRKPGSKPLLIMVITDGVPAPRMEPEKVAQTLVAATHNMRGQNEITVVFFQIGGGDRYGRYFLDQMDNDLVESGARFDIVRTVYFEQLQQQGLSQSLVASVKQVAAR
jgi:hypothetical protein